MNLRWALLPGIFGVMALSNAIVPVLPGYAPASAWQGAIYSAYFFGAFLTTLPAGFFADRFGQVPIIRAGLVLSVGSGILLTMIVSPVPVILLRLLEGVGSGLFVAAAMAVVNSQPDHEKMSGIFLAILNAGLVSGLAISGWLAVFYDQTTLGILIFTGVTAVAACASLCVSSPRILSPDQKTRILPLLIEDRWLWYSTIVLVGVTGVVLSLYPKFSGLAPDILGAWIAGMSLATIVSVLVISQMEFLPVPVIRISAILMAGAILLSFLTPLGFIAVGVLAGVVMIAQMQFLSGVSTHQGIVMGLFSTASYLGMAVLPALAGLVADGSGFLIAFCCTAILALTVAITIGRNVNADRESGS